MTPTSVTAKEEANAALRASDAERQRHVDLLTEHAAQGRLSVEELSERVDRAYAAGTRGELSALLDDLPVIAAPGESHGRRARARSELRAHLTSFVLVNLLLIAIWALTGAGYFWPVWPLLGWGIGLGSHASEVLWGRPLLGGSCGRRRSGRRALA